jgi:hypothetical protein
MKPNVCVSTTVVKLVQTEQLRNLGLCVIDN